MDNVAKSGMAKSGMTKKANIDTLENLGYCVPLLLLLANPTLYIFEKQGLKWRSCKKWVPPHK